MYFEEEPFLVSCSPELQEGLDDNSNFSVFARVSMMTYTYLPSIRCSKDA